MKYEPKNRKFRTINAIPESLIFEYCEKLLTEKEEREKIAQKETSSKSNTNTPPQPRKRPKTQNLKPQTKQTKSKQ